MTSPSRKKRRTTRPSTPSRKNEWWRVAVVVVLVGCMVLAAGFASAAEWLRFVDSPEQALELPSPKSQHGIVKQATVQEETDDSATVLASAEEGSEDDACAEEAPACRDALTRLFDDRLSGIDLDIRVGGRAGNDYPCECRLEGETYEPRRFASTTFTWTAAAYSHKPLYFEHWQLERYGHSYGPLADPWISAAHFFVTLPVLPYKMGTELPWECMYPLGHYRPGNCAPWTVPAVPISARGFAVEAATVTGLIFLFP